MQALESAGNPRLAGERLQVSRGGANLARCGRDGKELFCLEVDSKIYAVPVTLSPAANGRRPRWAFLVGTENIAAPPFPLGFDVSPDGQRFVVPVVRDKRKASIVVIKNWEGLLQSKAH